jgi:bifunctional UDP-N-acetylglucosamine pyrophosphorylase / glucosamine-1-phosphate N-acetyltransferase
MTPDIRVLIAAAGAGKRAGLSYPKTLYPVRGRPILLRLFDRMSRYDDRPAVVVSPAGYELVRHCLSEAGYAADLLIQEEPRGMGDAVLQFEQAPGRSSADHVLLAWGDIPFLHEETIATMVEAHLAHGNDFTFVSAMVDEAYSIVQRDRRGAVRSVTETREASTRLAPGERDIGLFIFRPDAILPLLKQDLAGATGRTTGEHGFLYVIGHATERGLKVEALPIAEALDLISMNRISDLDAIT